MFIEVIICLAAIAACVWVLITAVKTVFGKIKLAARELKQAEDIEKRYADAIMSKYVKNGKVPSWAYDQLLRELKAYCNRAEHLSFSTYFDDHKPEVVKLPEDFKLTTSASRNQLTEACVVRFRDFDLENYSRSGQLSDYEQETMVYLSRMWFFSDNFCRSLEEGEETVKACLYSFMDAKNPNSRSRYHKLNEQKYKDFL